MVASAWAMACSRAARVRAWAVRTAVLSFDPHGSIGDKSGDYGGKYTT
jgi:hypothetical protein